MKNFNGVMFQGKFRDYQQTVLNHSQRHLKDGTIHIVAAPGSGKTILGLELIRRQGAPALVLSPSVTIRQQWGERFEESFLPKGAASVDYLSYDLHTPSLITSVTYQALHAAFTKTAVKEEKDDEGVALESAQDYTDFDLFAVMKKAGITTVCLDEAHHLRREWQKALEGFIEKLGNSVKIIALTATPPYDSTPGEWNSYSKVCGEIDEEIFVPQLVAQKTLCPHQDFIYFNYPTEQETAILENYRSVAQTVTQRVMADGTFLNAYYASEIATKSAAFAKFVAENKEQALCLIQAVKQAGGTVPAGISLVAAGKKQGNLETAERAFQCILDNPSLFPEEAAEPLRVALAENGLIEKRKVCLASNDKIDKMLVASAGKLQSISAIAEAETKALGEGLRMLILTDYIKRDMLKSIGTKEQLTSMGTVPVFETVRRAVGDKVKIALLSGTLVILPDETLEQITSLAAEMDVGTAVKPIEGTRHSVVTLSGSNKNKVAVVTKAFQSGLIQVLVGTKSLLGEGWDAPCINSLILASVVGSFMLSNQMRGRAIRTDKTNPEKSSAIWHLVTAEPTPKGEPAEAILGADFKTVKRRFACFLAPAYHSPVIESGTERLDVIAPPFDSAGVETINGKMLALAADRKGIAESWYGTLGNCKCPEVVDVNEVPLTVWDKSYASGAKFTFVLWLVIAAALLLAALVIPFTVVRVIGVIAAAVCGIITLKNLFVLRRLGSAESFICNGAEAVLQGLKTAGEIQSGSAKTEVTPVSDKACLNCLLTGATVHEKNQFSKAITEAFSAIDDPRYVLVGQRKILSFSFEDYGKSFACPAALAVKKEYAAAYSKVFGKAGGAMQCVYTRSENGGAVLEKCREKARVNAVNATVNSKKIARIK